MDVQDFTALQTRLDKLEAKSRTLTFMLSWSYLGFAFLLFFLLITRQVGPGVVKARTFEVVDRLGNTSVRMGDLPDGSMGLSISDSTGKTRASLSMNQIGVPEFYLNDDKGQDRACLSLSKEGNPQMMLYGEDYRKVMDLYVYKDRPSLNFYDSKTQWRASYGLADDGSGLLTFMYPKGLPSAMLSTDENGTPSLALFGAKDAFTTIEPR
jgi:hypothetical protein